MVEGTSVKVVLYNEICFEWMFCILRRSHIHRLHYPILSFTNKAAAPMLIDKRDQTSANDEP